MIYCVLLNYNILIGGLSPLIPRANYNQLTRRFTSPMAICIINNTLGGLGGKNCDSGVSKSTLSPSITTPFIHFPRHTITTFQQITLTTSLEAMHLEQRQGQSENA